jgi:hypothetical protein
VREVEDADMVRLAARFVTESKTISDFQIPGEGAHGKVIQIDQVLPPLQSNATPELLLPILGRSQNFTDIGIFWDKEKQSKDT